MRTLPHAGARCHAAGGWAVAAGLLCGAPAAVAQPVSVVQVASVQLPNFKGQDQLTCVAQPPGDRRDLFLTSKLGRFQLVRNGSATPILLLDFRPWLNPSDEAGLLGMAFHPQFQSNGFVYLCYTGYLPGAGLQQPGFHVVRYTLNPGDPTTLDPSTASPVFYFQRNTDGGHNGGWVGFGPDGYLYISAGDGAGASGVIPQDPSSDLGKLLRIDVDHDDFPADPLANYAIPASNPYFGSATARPEVWAIGLRNPWRCSFDRLTGDLWIADVGQNTWEEIDLQPAVGPPPYQAVNYGWPCMEGPLCAPYPGCVCGSPAYAPPIYAYPHPPGVAVIGGYVYRGSLYPELQGAYFFADISGGSWSFRYGPGGVTDLTPRAGDLGTHGWSTFGEGSDGELYFTDSQFMGATTLGRVFEIVRPCLANCDRSVLPPVLNVNDFMCFLIRYAQGDSYANCDGSTTPPVLNAADFVCFQQRFAAGCP